MAVLGVPSRMLLPPSPCKSVCVGRECGLNMELDDVPVDSLVPAALRDVASVSDFMDLLHEYDDDMAAQLATAESNDECLRFVGASTSAHKQNQLSKCFLKGCACVHGLLHHCLDRDSQLHLLPASECSQIIQACIGGSCAYHRKSRQSRSHATGSDLCSRHAYFIMSLLMHAMSWYIVNCGHPGSGSVS